MALKSKRETAEYLGISKRTLERMIRDGEIGFYNVHDSVRISDEEIQRYLAAHVGTVHVQTHVQTQDRKAGKDRKKTSQRVVYVPGMKVV